MRAQKILGRSEIAICFAREIGFAACVLILIFIFGPPRGAPGLKIRANPGMGVGDRPFSAQASSARLCSGASVHPSFMHTPASARDLASLLAALRATVSKPRSPSDSLRKLGRAVPCMHA